MKKTLLLSLISFVLCGVLPAQWNIVTTAMTGRLESAVFTSATNGFTSGSFQYIYKTTDGGSTWSAAGSYDAKDLYFFDANNAYAAGVAGTGTMKNTTNGGASWTTLTPPNSSSLWGTFATSPTTCYFIATDKKVHKSINSGVTWTSVTLPLTFDPTDIWFTDVNTGFVSTQDGIIFKTTNAGVTWTTNYTASGGVLLNSIYFINTNVGFSCGSNGAILKTVNGGTSWTPQNSGVTTPLNCIRFYDALNGLVVGYGGKILYTTDGGTTWTLDVSNSTQALYGISYTANASSAIVVGDSGTVLKNTNIPAGVNEQSKPLYGISNFPNPANNFTTVTFHSTINQKVALRIVDMNGQLVKQFPDVQTVYGENKMQIDLADISQGIYFLQMQADAALFNQKLVVWR